MKKINVSKQKYMCLFSIKIYQQIKYSINYPQGRQHISIVIYFYHKEHQNIQVKGCHYSYIVLAFF